MNSIWIARDETGFLWAFSEKPVKYKGSWIPSSDEIPYDIEERLFPELKWEDDPIELVIKGKED